MTKEKNQSLSQIVNYLSEQSPNRLEEIDTELIAKMNAKIDYNNTRNELKIHLQDEYLNPAKSSLNVQDLKDALTNYEIERVAGKFSKIGNSIKKMLYPLIITGGMIAGYNVDNISISNINPQTKIAQNINPQIKSEQKSKDNYIEEKEDKGDFDNQLKKIQKLEQILGRVEYNVYDTDKYIKLIETPNWEELTKNLISENKYERHKLDLYTHIANNSQATRIISKMLEQKEYLIFLTNEYLSMLWTPNSMDFIEYMLDKKKFDTAHISEYLEISNNRKKIETIKYFVENGEYSNAHLSLILNGKN